MQAPALFIHEQNNTFRGVLPDDDHELSSLPQTENALRAASPPTSLSLERTARKDDAKRAMEGLSGYFEGTALS